MLSMIMEHTEKCSEGTSARGCSKIRNYPDYQHRQFLTKSINLAIQLIKATTYVLQFFMSLLTEK